MKRAMFLIALLAAVACMGPTGASAATKQKSHKFTSTIEQTMLSSTGNPPLSGTAVFVGTANGTYGKAAESQTTTFQGGGAFTATGTVFATRGSTSGRLSGTGTLNPDGSTSITGSGKVLRGTGIYAHATGSYTFTGTQAKGSSVVTLHLKGTVKY